MKNLFSLPNNITLLKKIQRGIEREGLRIDHHGKLAADKHPSVLGAALTHPNITTDYSESLIELITQPHQEVSSLLKELTEVHQFVLQNLPKQSIWGQSMPCHLPEEKDIPIAEYGTSNSGKLKHVYRQGLAIRYGKKMQCIAGLHYNFSLPDDLWQALDTTASTQQEKQNNGYMALIRNFKRYAWLLMYLFGASPAVNGSFLNDKQKQMLNPLREGQDDTYYLPYATSLRMSDLGYQNDVQANLKSCFNTLSGFSKLIYNAVSTPWPAYEEIGTQRDGKWLQLNTNVLQIENEFYATIRPKRTHGRGDRPVIALMRDGIQYIEVRCIDLDPFSPIGISDTTCYFLDTFLLFCAITESPLFPGVGECKESEDNFNLVVNYGRQPNLILNHHEQAEPLQTWGLALLEKMIPFAKELDAAYHTSAYSKSLATQKEKLLDVNLCPSSQVLALLQQSTFNESMQKLSVNNSNFLRQQPLSAESINKFRSLSEESIRKQKALEVSDDIDFITYLQRFKEALHIKD